MVEGEDAISVIPVGEDNTDRICEIEPQMLVFRADLLGADKVSRSELGEFVLADRHATGQCVGNLERRRKTKITLYQVIQLSHHERRDRKCLPLHHGRRLVVEDLRRVEPRIEC